MQNCYYSIFLFFVVGRAAERKKRYMCDLILSLAVAYAGFSKGGGGREFRKFEINEDENENFPAQNQVRFLAQKIGEHQKKRFSPKFSPVFGQNKAFAHQHKAFAHRF